MNGKTSNCQNIKYWRIIPSDYTDMGITSWEVEANNQLRIQISCLDDVNQDLEKN